MSLIHLEHEIPFEEAVAEVPKDEFLEVDGQSVYVKDIGTGPAIVMLHGFASSSYSFRELFGPLSESFRILAIDLNGFGLTQRPQKATAYRIGSQADLIVEILKKKGIAEVVMLGHSYGSAVSAVLAARHPVLVSKVVLVSPPSEFAGKPPWYVRNALGIRVAFFLIRALLSNPEKFRELSSKAVHVEGVLTPEVSEIYRRSMLIEGLKSACFGYAKAFGGNGAASIRYDAISQPTLVIVGEQDGVVSPESCTAVSYSIPGSQLTVIPECGHCPPEERPAEVLEAVGGFLQGG